ncbi:MAG TPA: 2-amino-4-hydroxy-6-hydroxymethyldihydropteridine diphosphokinase [Planctomycetes bacterium]|nr:2-amino-4-hydroxy-6-hydroxymethyldihydropteridine diphosphokinase [Planctomycetota bacterium]
MQDRPVDERAWIALGANLGDREAALDGAVRELASAPDVRVLRVSPWIETDPVGGPVGQGRYLNGVLEARVAVGARALLDLLQRIEGEFGRDRSREVRNGPRTLDLDLLLYGTARLREPGLVVPHPRLEERRFVLEPLVALEPDLVLPSGRTARGALANLPAPARIGMR